jgi:hypothetical protein
VGWDYWRGKGGGEVGKDWHELLELTGCLQESALRHGELEGLGWGHPEGEAAVVVIIVAFPRYLVPFVLMPGLSLLLRHHRRPRSSAPGTRRWRTHGRGEDLGVELRGLRGGVERGGVQVGGEG